jgi:hypothetical protein
VVPISDFCPALQLILGFVRPTAKAPMRHRHIWDVVHSTVGRASMLIGLANVGLGVYIFCHTYNGDFGMWASLCAAGLCGVSLLQYLTDRQEKYAVLRNDREVLLKSQDDATVDGETDMNGESVPTSPHKSFPGKGSETAAAAAAATPLAYADVSGQGSDSCKVQQAVPGTAAAYGGIKESGNSVKLTANLLQRHQATADSSATAGMSVAHLDFVRFGQQTGDTDHVEWDQRQGWQQQQLQHQMVLQQQQQQQQQLQQQVQQQQQQQQAHWPYPSYRNAAQ